MSDTALFPLVFRRDKLELELKNFLMVKSCLNTIITYISGDLRTNSQTVFHLIDLGESSHLHI